MLISRAHDLGFVHIAKCAGSTIRQQLREHDDAQGRFYRSVEHPELGWINGNHIPLARLRSHFPDSYAALQDVTSYTVLRAPLDRFVSGVSQYIRDLGAEPGELTGAQIADHARDVMRYLRALEDTGEPPDPLHILFARQIDYVFVDGERIVDHVYAMEHLDALFDVLDTRHGLTLIRDKIWNPTVTYRYPALTNTLKRLKTLAQKVLPMRLYVKLRGMGERVFTTKGVPQLSDTLEGLAEVRDFVADYYADDIALHAAALSGGPDAATLAAGAQSKTAPG